jgi:hypothetical protein
VLAGSEKWLHKKEEKRKKEITGNIASATVHIFEEKRCNDNTTRK